MAEFTVHAPGTFCWAELATTDQPGGLAFYRALFGWDVDEHNMGPAGFYSMFLLRGKEVAAAYTMRPEERQPGVPPHWNLYVTVENADETVARAAALGGRVFMPPFEVMDNGRMAVLQDPAGAVFQVWQPKASIGAKILSEPGALCWSELTTRDTAAAESFYTQLFGWATKPSQPGGAVPYTEFINNGHPGAGMLAMPDDMPATVPSYWMPYFQVDDCDASVATATGLGATTMVPPSDIPNTGRFSILQDPQGAMFAVFRFAAV